MKKQIIPVLLVLIYGLTLSSCYDDKSSLDADKLPEVVIDVTGTAYPNGVIHAGYMEKLTLSPKITKDGAENRTDLSYKWSLAQTPSSMDHDVISEEKELDYVIRRAIEPKAYKLWLTVTDNGNTMEYQYFWDLYVESTFGEGILVSYTKDGTTSDFALIMDPQISSDYNKPASVREGLYQAANGGPISSLIRNTCYTADAYRWSSYQNIIRATKSDGGILFVNCKDYSRMDDEMIFVPTGFVADKFIKVNSGTIFNAGAAGVYLMDMNSKKPAMPALVHDNGGVADMKISGDSFDGSESPAAIWYHNGKFYRFNSNFSSPKVSAFDNTGITAAFDPTNLPNKECKAAGLSSDKETHTFLMKDKTSGSYAIYTFSKEVTNWSDPDLSLPARAKAKIDIPASLNTMLNDAVSVFFINDYPVMYVATQTVITPVIFGGGVVTTGTAYSVPAGESLTIAKLFQQGVYVDNREEFDSSYSERISLPLNNRAVYFATSTGQYTGNVYVVPMVTNQVSSGTLDTSPAKILKFTGFGKILEMTVQGK